jgi:hypothetical protein
MTNREAHEEAAGMNLDDMFFKVNGIDPDEEYIDPEVIYPPGAHIPNQCYLNYGRDLDGCSRQENEGCRGCILYKE